MTRTAAAILLALASCALAAASLPTAGTADVSGVTYADRPLDVAGELSVVGRGEVPTVRNRQATRLAPSFSLRDGDSLYLRDLILSQNGWPPNRGLHLIGGAAELVRVGIRDGDGVSVERGALYWRGGGTVGSTYSYSLYLGNNVADEDERRMGRGYYSWSRPDRDDFVAVGVVVDGVAFQCGRAETSVRAMGAVGMLLRGCTFGVAPDFAKPTADRHNKQAVQIRHATGVLQDCAIDGSIVVGGLDPSIDAGKHADYARRNPTRLWIRGGTINGYLEVSSNTRVLLDGVRVTGRDPRGIGPTQGIARKSYGAGLDPAVYIVHSEIGHWTLSGVKVFVGPGVTRGGVPVPRSPDYDAAAVQRLRDEAARDVPAWARP